MEEHRDQVSDSVYLKVKADYETQIEEVRGQFDEKCGQIETELQKLYAARTEQETELAKHQEVLEEAKFRHTLGEYTDKKFKDVETKQNKEIKNYSKLIDQIKGSIEQYEKVLGREFNPDKVPASIPEPAEVEAAVEEISIGMDDISLPTSEHTPAAGIPMEEKNSGVPEQSVTDAFLPDTQEKAASKGTEAEAPQSQLDQELDSFLQTEGDSFGGGEAEETGSTGEEAAPEPPPPPAAKAPPDEDSISKILQDIPMEEATAEGENKAEDEVTGSKIALGEMPEASLLLLEGELEEPEYILSETTSIGRSPSNDVVLKESKVSRQHAAIHFRDGHFVIVDLKSSNGIVVNDQKVEEHYLQDGDEVRIGSFKFQFNIL
ncbi:MAG: FHA domain-containing protein [bacterium]|nr:FHA domain-containing protein [bacterium]